MSGIINSTGARSGVIGTTVGTPVGADPTAGIGDGEYLSANANVADDDFLRVDGTAIEGRTALETLGDIGQYSYLNGIGTYGHLRRVRDNQALAPGAVDSTNVLNYSNCGNVHATAATMGTWRLMGNIPSTTNGEQCTSLFVRVA